jgi:hypothetical protein
MSDEDVRELLRREAEHAEQHQDAPAAPDTTVTRPGATRSTVYSIRLAPTEVAALEAQADAAGIPPSTLARAWIIEHLHTSPHIPEQLRRAIHDEVRNAIREALE